MKIHLKSRQGLFTVVTYGRNSITLCTKHETFSVPSEDFKCFAGGGWAESTAEEQRLFMSVVAPEYVAKQNELDAAIIALAKAINQQDKQRESMKQSLQELEESVAIAYPDDEYEPSEPTKEDYEKWWRQEADKNTELNNKMRSIAHQVYSQNLDFSNFQNHKGIKFIIQTNNDETEFRFCWDPYGFVDNFHSSISHIYRENGWYTKNGGWIKIIDDNVILYAKSGDYGVYNDTVAIECAKRLFPNKEIHSYAGRQWDSELDNLFTELPF